MTRRYFSGNTLDQAVMMAARHYGLDPEELAYRQIEKRHGFLRTRKAVLIAVDPEQPRRGEEGPAEAAAEPIEIPVAPAPAVAISPVTLLDPAATERPAAGDAEPARRGDEEPAGRATDDRQDEPAEPRRAPRDDRRAAPAAAGPGEQDDELLGAAERAAHILLKFAGIDAGAAARSGAERVEVDLEGPDSSVLVVENGKGLLAIQHLLPRMMRGLVGRSSFVRVDSEGFHGKRKERLQALALKEAEAVSRDGSPRTLPPMAADERRIVHLAVQEIPTVVTESRGSGLHKRVVIRPVAADGGHDDIEARHGF